jgi:glycosyltransferase involved in cell wall biosynthesis
MKTKNDFPLVSIIVPVYNTEKYLAKCINSILAQTLTNFECILVDDGSSDNCPIICDKYTKKDKRILVVHQKNSGVSAARNAGLDIAKGVWIGFVDSDDWCEPNMFKFLYENALKYNADVSVCNWNCISSDGHIIKQKIRKREILYNGTSAARAMFDRNPLDSGPCTKLIKSYYFTEKKIRFDTTIKYAEDALLLNDIFKYSNRIIYSPSQYYNYFYSPNSSTRQPGLTEAAKTFFFAYDKMLLSESNKMLKSKIKSRKTVVAAELALYYVSQADYTNSSYHYLKNIISVNYFYILFNGSIKLKNKLLYLLCLFPILCIFSRKIYKKLIKNPRSKLRGI